ncbi:MAG: hypothetical protein ISR82_04155 [Candidatus Marinimicrobia bacterium]|nr:hypothetical protein [Candidatus Neomarinimicrobiota bacterium]MBL7010395.1 hypothetical protein [Candidatus Neomarinimicrobiota bacterium]MBL7030844.1 hypothetical protein [Candidatus Neomarinimicrobiota bacterium]
MKTVKLTILTFILLFLTAGERQVKYFFTDHDFLTGHDVPKSEIINKNHVRAEYDLLDRLILKTNINRNGDVLFQEQYTYIDSNTIIRQKDLVDDSGHIFYQTIFGREPQSISYIEWVFGVDSVKKWNDRFTTSDLNEMDKPDNYRFYDVDAFEYGGKGLDYDSLGRVTRDEWFRRPDNKSMHKFLYTFYDDLNITHMFEYDSNGVLIMDVKLSPDGTEAVFWFTGPPDSSIQNHSTVAYNLDGDLSWGYINWVVPGEIDSGRVDLSEIFKGDYTIMLENDSALQDSAVYDIHFNGKGVKGYMATQRTIHHITYDISPPIMTLEMDKYLKDVALSFSATEPIDSAYIVWAPDSNFAHITSDTIILTRDERLATDRFKPSHQTDLVDGVMYDPEIYAFDIAGNLSLPGIRQDVIYDITPPVLTISEPLSGAWVNHQNMGMNTNEPIQTWSLMAEWQGGVLDENAPHTHAFSDTVQSNTSMDLSAYFQLNDGSTYSYSIVGMDLAGNVSDTISIDSIHFDITPPVLTMIFPFNEAAIKDPTVSYASSEILLAGDFLWTQMEGSADSLSPHIVTLLGDELSSDEKIHIHLENEPILTDGSVYSILLTGQDLAGNESEPVIVTNVLFDTTPPEFSNILPDSGSALNQESVSYNISENLHKGEIIWEWTGGVKDPDSPHKVDLAPIEMALGLHDSIQLSNMPKLIDGGIYSILFTGSDRAGNLADTVIVSNILYDYTPPEMVIEYPLPRSISNTTAMTYSLSEDLFEGQFKWIWLGGVEDTLAPYIAILTEEERGGGEHSQVELVNNPTVVENALYTMMFSGRDRAGNKTKRAFVPGLQYDFTPPTLTWINPEDGDAINHKNIQFSNSELLESGTITWTWTDGKEDPDSSHIIELEGQELSGNEFGPGVTINEPPLVDGGIYTITYTGFDPAGNESNRIAIGNVLYDITQPEITINYPLPKSISRTSAVTYTLSEDLHEGKFKWIWLGGVKDTLAPYTAILTEEERKEGNHIEIELSNNPTVVENALYTMTIIGQDRAGNKTKRAFVPGLQYDFTPPELTIISPVDGDAINHHMVHFSNSELLKSGQMIWRRTGGSDDFESPHIIDLVNEELHGIEMGPLNITNSPHLVDGAVYSFLYVAHDPAGNQSDTVRVDNILYDITPPTFTFTFPESNVFTTETKLLFDVSEDIFEFNITWDGKGLGDETDPIAFNYFEVLNVGSYNSDALYLPELKDSFTYRISLNGVDRAGNAATPVSLTDVRIDLTPPEFTAFTPESVSFINHMTLGWTLSEDIASGKVVFQQTGIDTKLEAELVDLELIAGERLPLVLQNSVVLKDGVSYTISIHGIDFAGNVSEELKVENITYDISPPELIMAHPKTDSFVNFLDVVYASNEPLLSGRMIWINDREEKMIYELRSEDIHSGKHVLVDYGIQPEENMPYSIMIEGTDLAVNEAISSIITNVMFDVTPPTLTILSPLPNTPVNTSKLSISISEPIELGSIRWEVVKGNDPKTPHIKALNGEYLKGGEFIEFDFSTPPELVNNVTYKITIEGTDLAGNPSEPMIIDNILYDTTPPEFVNISPMDDQHIREPDITYTLTENLEGGKIYFDHVGGSSDPKTTHMITLAGSKKRKGTQGGKLPASFVKLVNGAIYNIRFVGIDAAGNMAPETIVKNIAFDNEVPTIIISEPTNNSYRNTKSITFSISEDLAEGTIALTQIAGKSDPNAPYTIIFDEDGRKEGDYENTIFPDLAWVDGATYTLTINGTDRAGNVAKESIIKNITYDVTPPVITLINIHNDSYINTTDLSYTLSENIEKSIMTFTQTDGSPDPRSPQVIELKGSELEVGDYLNRTLGNGPNLQNGSIYQIEFTGIDAAGNEALPVLISNVTFDNQPPEMSISRPLDTEQIKTTIISYMSNELLETATVIFEQTSGTIDVNSPHRIPLNGALLTEGVHSDYDLGITSQLADGGRYRVSVEAFDKAGNPAKITPINDVFFDVLPPDLSLSEPKSGSVVNLATITYSTSEDMGKGKMIFTRTGGAEDPTSPHENELTEGRLKQGDHYQESFDNDVQLKDGSIYSIEFSGEDLAGNVAVNVSVENITFDTSPPIIVISQPKANGFYNQLMLDYELNEKLTTGQIVLERRGGTVDPMSPHKIDLVDDQLNTGQQLGIQINTLTNLVSNTTYNIWIEGQDVAGNVGKSKEITGVTFDNIPPDISVTFPEEDSYINSTTLGLRTNEVLSEANIEWIWVDGNPDPVGTHESKMVGNQLQDGDYPEVNFDPPPSLTSSARYRVVYHGTDRAGNNATYELGTLFFDSEPPEISALFPTENGFTNVSEVSYELNEPLLMANLIWTPVDGSGPIAIDLTGIELEPGLFAKTTLANQSELTDGTVYNLSITAIDRSGNEAEISLSNHVTYDKSKPKFTQVFPSTSARVNSQLIKWTVNEELVSGQYTWIHMGGNADPAAPHTFELTPELLSGGPHDNSTLPDLELVTDAMYRITLQGTDKAGNTGKKFIMSIVYDDIPPELEIKYPESNTAVNHLDVAYGISEGLSSGKFIYTRVGGVPDPNSPVSFDLVGNELETIFESPTLPKNPPVLQDGSIYNIIFEGVDLAMNASSSNLIDSVKYDVTRPVITIHNPQAKSNLMGVEISIEISENLMDGKMVWTRTGGLKSRVTRQKIPLYNEYLTEGMHPHAKLPMDKTLSASVIYSLSVDARDFAKNQAEPVSVEGIEYIRSMAGKWYYKGQIIEVVWVFEPDESGIKGNFMQGLSLGTKISDQESGKFAFDFSKKPWVLTLEMDNPEKNRISLMEFLDNTHMRVVTGVKKPRTWQDGEVMEYEWRPE